MCNQNDSHVEPRWTILITTKSLENTWTEDYVRSLSICDGVVYPIAA